MVQTPLWFWILLTVSFVPSMLIGYTIASESEMKKAQDHQ